MIDIEKFRALAAKVRREYDEERSEPSSTARLVELAALATTRSRTARSFNRIACTCLAAYGAADQDPFCPTHGIHRRSGVLVPSNAQLRK